jgi:hypothetical protein
LQGGALAAELNDGREPEPDATSPARRKLGGELLPQIGHMRTANSRGEGRGKRATPRRSTGLSGRSRSGHGRRQSCQGGAGTPFTVLFKKLQDKEWVQSRPGVLKYAGYAVLRLAHRVTGVFSSSFNLGTVLLSVVQGALVLAITFAPLIFAEVIAPWMGLPINPPTSIATNPYYQSAFFFTLLILKTASDHVKANRGVGKERLATLRSLAISLSATLGAVRNQIVEFASDPIRTAELEGVFQHALNCIESTVRLCIDRPEDKGICATLLTFEPNDRLRIRSRSKLDRQSGTSVPQDNKLAFLAAKFAQDFLAIQNFRMARWFRKINPVERKSLTSTAKPRYDSILLFPLPAVPHGGQNRIRKGVVTIDAERPYEFLGKEVDILIRSQSYLDLINLMLTNHTVGIVPEI